MLLEAILIALLGVAAYEVGERLRCRWQNQSSE
jgi:hypothetical protein